jgi:hypothetical protein
MLASTALMLASIIFGVGWCSVADVIIASGNVVGIGSDVIVHHGYIRFRLVILADLVFILGLILALMPIRKKPTT